MSVEAENHRQRLLDRLHCVDRDAAYAAQQARAGHGADSARQRYAGPVDPCIRRCDRRANR